MGAIQDSTLEKVNPFHPLFAGKMLARKSGVLLQLFYGFLHLREVKIKTGMAALK
jgi:hypothetical protein